MFVCSTQELQDRAIRITKSTEQLVASGHFAGEQATEQSYAILATAAEYMNDLDQYEDLLTRAIHFFESTQSVSLNNRPKHNNKLPRTF